MFVVHRLERHLRMHLAKARIALRQVRDVEDPGAEWVSLR